MENRVLPMDIIAYGILVRLDVKSLLRFRSVNSHWLSLLRHPSFLRLHSLSLSPPTPLLLLSFFNPTLHRHFLYSAPARGGPATELLSFPASGFRISDSAAGLVCLYRDEVAAVFNPSTREILRLPPSAYPMVPTSHLRYEAGCAIGYDQSAGVHKVVRSCTMDARRRRTQVLEVLTLGGGAWRSVEWPEGVDLIGEARGCVVNGGAVYYMGVRRNREESNKVIVVFEVKDEKLRVLGVPVAVTNDGCVELVEMEGKLGVTREREREHEIAREISLVWIYEEKDQRWRATTRKKEAWFRGRRACREQSWWGVEEDGSYRATVRLADGREVAMRGMLHGLHENGTFVDYVETFMPLPVAPQSTLLHRTSCFS